jgi:hypothetical protein
MKWFDKWFQKQAKRAWDAAQKEQHNLIYNEDGPRTVSNQIRNLHPSKDYVDFKLWFADNGGYIVEFSKYDRIKDRCNNQIYIIPDGLETLGAELTEIVTQYVISNR